MLVMGIGTGQISWQEVPFIIGLNADMLLKTTVHAPGGASIEKLTVFLDSIYPGILRDLADKFLEPVRLLAEEVLEFSDSVYGALAAPHQFFGKEGIQYQDDFEATRELWETTLEHIFHGTHCEKPMYAVRAVRAMFAFGLGRYFDSIVDGGYALNEKAIPDFAEQLSAETEEATKALLKVEEQKAEILVGLIVEYRRRT